jgi:hypothetical protein
MNRHIISLLGALFVVGASLGYAQAQAPAGEGPGGQKPRQQHDCSKAPDPARCEARRKERKERKEIYAKAQEACKGKTGDEQRNCMREQRRKLAPAGDGQRGAHRHQKVDCSKVQDPAQCEARRKEMSERFKQAQEACKGKAGDEMRNCMRAQRKGR